MMMDIPIPRCYHCGRTDVNLTMDVCDSCRDHLDGLRRGRTMILNVPSPSTHLEAVSATMRRHREAVEP